MVNLRLKWSEMAMTEVRLMADSAEIKPEERSWVALILPIDVPGVFPDPEPTSRAGGPGLRTVFCG
jgi:hypothetical protein